MNLEKRVSEMSQKLLHVLESTKDLEVDAISIDLGQTNYSEVLRAEAEIVEIRKQNPRYKDLILFMEHLPTIDFGRKPKNNFFLDKALNVLKPYENPERVKEHLSKYGLDFSLSERPGGPAYLGPGQLIIHFVADCKKAGIKNPLEGQHRLDLVMKHLSQNLGVEDVQAKNPQDTEDKRDVYLEREAFPDIAGRYGLKVGSKVAAFANFDFMYNGLSLFINREATKGFRFIPACGYSKEDLEVISIQEILERRGKRYGEISRAEAKEKALKVVSKVFIYKNGVMSFDLHHPKEEVKYA